MAKTWILFLCLLVAFLAIGICFGVLALGMGSLPSAVVAKAPPPPAKLVLPAPWQAALVPFVTVFVAEMGDKTQLATMLMSAQTRSPWAIFFGSASALVVASSISVVLGEGISQILPPSTLQIVAGLGFIGMGGFVLWQEWGSKGVDRLAGADDLK